MRAGPRAASGSPPEAAVQDAELSRFPAVRRLRKPAQFKAVNSDPQAIRATRRWLAIAGSVQLGQDNTVPVRIGFTAGRRYARRAVERNAVKRILREAARQQIEALDAAAGGRSVDVVMRLRAPAPTTLARAQWKRALREEADGLLGELAARLRRRGARE